MKARQYSTTTILAAVLLMPGVAAAQQPMQVGTHHTTGIVTPQFYAGPNDGRAAVVWRYVLDHPGATYLAVHFVDFDLGPGDYLSITDAQGAQAYKLEGLGKMDAGTFWARHIKGGTAILELVSTQSGGGYGFVIDEYVTGDVALGDASGPGGTRAICAPDDKQNAICYQTSHPTEYDRSRAVARLLINGSGLCTGWLASSDDHLITNEHCITTASDALNTDYEFMAEAPSCGSSNCQLCFPGAVFSGATFIQDSPNLDYALVQINSGNPSATYGFLDLDNRAAIPGEEIYIPQHPGGRAKELAIFSTHSSDAPSGIAHVFSISEPPCSGSGFNDVGYYADTEGGSSGSPVLARASNKVIALHHCANCPNRGVPINLIYPEIEQYLTHPPTPPVAENVDAGQLLVGTPVAITLVATDVNDDPLTYAISALPSHGQLSDPGAGAISTVPYTLAAGGNQVVYAGTSPVLGPDAFSYRANDGAFDSNTAQVTLLVIAPPPVILTSSPLPAGQVGVPYGPLTMQVQDGQPEIVWSRVSTLAYAETDLGTNAFQEVGVAQAWNGDDRFWDYTLPFAFPLYNTTQTTVRVWSNGFLNFGPHTGSSYANTSQLLIDNRRIAPLWDDLKTSDPGDDIFIDETVAGEVTFRWKAHTYNGGAPCAFATTLRDNGDIVCHNGPGNETITPTIGVSNGNGLEYTLSAMDGAPSLNNANSRYFKLLQDLPAGVDLSTNGVLSGTPTEAGLFEAVLRATDSLGRFDQKSFSLTIAPFVPGNGDYDADGDVDLTDFAAFQTCFTGEAAGPAATGCAVFYADPDGDVDLSDLSAFIGDLRGP